MKFNIYLRYIKSILRVPRGEPQYTGRTIAVNSNKLAMINRCDMLLKSYHEAQKGVANRYCDLIFEVCEQYADGVPMGEIDDTIKEYVLKIKDY